MVNSQSKEAQPFFAHSLPGQSQEKWETMAEHEEAVATLCSKFLSRIDTAFQPWGNLLGRWHDLGKYSSEFQKYLFQENKLLHMLSDIHRVDVSGRVDHSTAAAQFAVERFSKLGVSLAYCFAGHHTGLPDWDDGQSQAGLKQRLDRDIPVWQKNAPVDLRNVEQPLIPRFPPVNRSDANRVQIAAFRVSFWIRMMFSALVDADFLTTESFMSPDRAAQRNQSTFELQQLLDCLEFQLAEIESQAADTKVNQIRNSVSAQCAEAAQLEAGFFSLSVPTGGGKTLASLRFALRHAITHGLDRVIIAVPFTSIIEQNATRYKEIFESLGNDVVLEHHSNLDPDQETSENRLQAENWNAPIVVTTNVQFFESLFAYRTSKCRKLHRIARSIIILDEAQSLPIELLKPTLLVLRELVESYGCSVILCSATQPALDWRSEFEIGLKNVRPIIANPNALYNSLRRTQVTVAGKLDDEQLAYRLNNERAALCVVNTRAHAANLFNLLSDDENRFHLSTRMCAAHRLEILNEVRQRLKNRELCRAVSTQLIEAGVDVDFPVVYRASCGLDSLAQAAGRCNREGLLEYGDVFLFDAEKPPPPGFLRQSADSGQELLDDFDDLLSPEAIEAYFRLHYWKNSASWDAFDVLGRIGKSPDSLQFNFRQAADRYKFIRDASESVLVRWNVREDPKIAALFRKLEDNNAFMHRNDWRHLQRYIVQVRQQELQQLQQAGAVEKLHERWVLIQDHLYNEKQGLRFEAADGILPVQDLLC